MERAKQDQWRIAFGGRTRCTLHAPGEPMKGQLVYQSPDEGLARRVYAQSTFGSFDNGYRLSVVPNLDRLREVTASVALRCTRPCEVSQ